MLCLSSSSSSDDGDDDRERSTSSVETIGLRQNLQDEGGSESIKKTEFVSKWGKITGTGTPISNWIARRPLDWHNLGQRKGVMKMISGRY